ncbi:MAG TPA: short-chain dehydrogenase [Holosporales bacterium]|nr:short-chain dehydrogenase [Holosporales bacterium]
MKKIFLLSLFMFCCPKLLEANNILILNASSQLGQGVAKHLQQKNHHLFLTARNLQKLKEFEDSTIINLDYTKSTQDLEEKLQGRKLDGIVVITPRPRLGSHYLPKADDWRECFNEGFIGPLEALRVAIPHLQSGGKIVIIGGLTSVSALDAHQHFSVLRMMWLGQAKGLARTLAKDKIHVNTIALGGTLTGSFKEGIKKRAKENGREYKTQLASEVDNIPLKNYATPQQIAHVVSFLLSKDSDHMTGVNIPLDGGFHRSY